MGARVQVSAVAAAVALTLALAALALMRGGRQLGESEALQIGAGDGTFTDDSLRIKRERMVDRLKGLRGVEGSMREQLATLNSQEHALEHAWQTTEASTDGRRGRHARETREALSSSIFSPAFPGAQSGLSVCEPWPSCCPSGNADNCFGVVSGGVLGAHACSPYPMCCGLDTHNCFDETSLNMTPDDGAAAPSEVDITHLAAVCEGEEQLKQCLTQTQSCMSPSSKGISADTCTCFSSSLYCSYPQTPESCSPCPLACQQKIYEWFKASQTEMDGTEMQCPLFEKAQANEDIAALDDGSFRPYAWFSDKELNPAPPPPKVVATGKEPFQTPPIHIKWPALDSYKYPYKPAPDPYYPKYYRWYEEPAYTSPRYVGPRPRPHADRPKYYPPHQPTWSNYVNPKVAEREYVEAPYSYSFPHKSSIPPHMIDGYDMNKHVLDA